MTATIAFTGVLLFLCAARQQAPARDTRPPALARAASIAGRVVDDRGEPVGAAIVNLIGGPPPGARIAVTRDDGRFAWSGVPPATYVVRAAKAGYPAIEYGQERPGGAGSPLTLKPGQRLALDVRLPRGAVIAGWVLDDAGEPAGGHSVHVVPAAGRRLIMGGGRPSDARGRYRIWGLAAGTYRVTTGSYDPRRQDALAVEGVTVTLAPGQVVDGIDVRVAPPQRTTLVTITPSISDGGPLQNLRVDLRRPGERDGVSYGRRGADGSVTFSGVIAGRYIVRARTQGHWGGTEITVDGEQPASAFVTLTPGVPISGHAVFSSARPPRERFWMTAISVDVDGLLSPTDFEMAQIAPSGEFAIVVPPGRYLLRSSGGWSLVSAMHGDVDVADVPLEVEARQIRGIVATLSPGRPSRIRGVVSTPAGAPASAADVIFFPVDLRYRTRASRRVATARTSVDGAYEVSGLPGGAYGIAVVEDFMQDSLQDPDWLATLRAVSTVTITAGETRQHDFTIRK